MLETRTRAIQDNLGVESKSNSNMDILDRRKHSYHNLFHSIHKPLHKQKQTATERIKALSHESNINHVSAYGESLHFPCESSIKTSTSICSSIRSNTSGSSSSFTSTTRGRRRFRKRQSRRKKVITLTPDVILLGISEIFIHRNNSSSFEDDEHSLSSVSVSSSIADYR